jgi:hypothetical protein
MTKKVMGTYRIIDEQIYGHAFVHSLFCSKSSSLKMEQFQNEEVVYSFDER